MCCTREHLTYNQSCKTANEWYQEYTHLYNITVYEKIRITADIKWNLSLNLKQKKNFSKTKKKEVYINLLLSSPTNRIRRANLSRWTEILLSFLFKSRVSSDFERKSIDAIYIIHQSSAHAEREMISTRRSTWADHDWNNVTLIVPCIRW